MLKLTREFTRIAKTALAISLVAGMLMLVGVPFVYALDWSQTNSDGFGDGNNIAIMSMVVHDGNLMAGTHNESTGGEVWKHDGDSGWSQMNTDGFGDAGNLAVTALVSDPVTGSLFAGTANARAAELWEYDGSWRLISIDEIFLGEGVTRIYSLAMHTDLVHIATDGTNGAMVWEYDAGMEVGEDWTQINTDGFGDSENKWAASLLSFGGSLWAGT